MVKGALFLEFLKFLEGLRTPLLDSFFSMITHLGEETIFILVGLFFFWCINKKHGYYILFVGFLGTVLNQVLKLLFRIPRPWVRDKNFTIVESARAEATGYSFPSGHTQTAVGVFGGIARFNKNIIVRILCIIVCLLVPLSRMYLGVHTPLDVGVSFIIALILIFGVYPLVEKSIDSKKSMRVLFLVMTLISVSFLIFVLTFNFPTDTDAENLAHGVKNAYKILGCISGLWIAFEIDSKFIKFETKAVWWVQVLKLIIGLAILLGIKSGLKAPLSALFDGSYIADGIRYFFVVIFAGCLWPLTFKHFNKLSKKH